MQRKLGAHHFVFFWVFLWYGEFEQKHVYDGNKYIETLLNSDDDDNNNNNNNNLVIHIELKHHLPRGCTK